MTWTGDCKGDAFAFKKIATLFFTVTETILLSHSADNLSSYKFLLFLVPFFFLVLIMKFCHVCLRNFDPAILPHVVHCLEENNKIDWPFSH